MNVCYKLGRTPLLTAFIAGAGAEAVQELLKNREDPDEVVEVGRNTAEVAILYCLTEVVQIILVATKKVEDN